MESKSNIFVLPTAIRQEGTDDTAELLALAVQTGGIGIYQTDFERDQTTFSPELCTILGLPVGTVMTFAQASRLFDERDQAAVQASVKTAAKSADQGKWSGVHRVVRADGMVRWVSINGRRTYRQTPRGPKPVRSVGTVIDITHLKATEEALRENERRLRFTLDAAQMGTFEADITGSQATIDAQEARLLGLSEETRVVSSDELRKRVPLEDLAPSDAKKKRLTEAGVAYHHEFRLHMPDGSERWLSAFADIRSNRIFGVNFDVSERKRSEAALHKSEARLRIATDGAALGVFEWDAKSDHAVWENERMYEIFGRSRAEGPLSKKQFVNEYLDPNDAQDFEAALERAQRTGGQFHATCRITRHDGSRRQLEFDGKFGTTGSPARLIGVVTDVTARKRLERRTQRLSGRLVTIQEEERQRIAQELHDSTVQHLVAASLTMMRLKQAPRLQREEETLWSDVKSSLQEAMKELRSFSYLMHPPILHGKKLGLALREYLGSFSDRSGFDVTLRLNPRIDCLPRPLQRSLFRVVQEAVANVYRHASASRAAVQLRCIGDRLHVVITDYGRGDGVGQGERRPQFHPGVGIRGIRTRIKELGGKLKIIAGPEGTTLHAAVPTRDTPARRRIN